jgi:hypothetical protein
VTSTCFGTSTSPSIYVVLHLYVLLAGQWRVPVPAFRPCLGLASVRFRHCFGPASALLRHPCFGPASGLLRSCFGRSRAEAGQRQGSSRPEKQAPSRAAAGQKQGKSLVVLVQSLRSACVQECINIKADLIFDARRQLQKRNGMSQVQILACHQFRFGRRRAQTDRQEQEACHQFRFQHVTSSGLVGVEHRLTGMSKMHVTSVGFSMSPVQVWAASSTD